MGGFGEQNNFDPAGNQSWLSTAVTADLTLMVTERARNVSTGIWQPQCCPPAVRHKERSCEKPPVCHHSVSSSVVHLFCPFRLNL
jgi:hypothetical protein